MIGCFRYGMQAHTMPVLASMELHSSAMNDPHVASWVVVLSTRASIRMMLATQTNSPSTKRSIMPAFLRVSICNLRMTGRGIRHTQISRIVLNGAQLQRKAMLSTQWPGSGRSQYFSIGMHCMIVATTKPRVPPATMAIDARQTIRNLGVGKSLI